MKLMKEAEQRVSEQLDVRVSFEDDAIGSNGRGPRLSGR